jgi:type 2A phosphatase activator TIP41
VDRLKQMEPILFYDENILFEDELADNGTATLTTRLVRIRTLMFRRIRMFARLVKFTNFIFDKRVMPSCFFLLLRFFLRVDDVLFRVNDTRIYHQFGTNHIIREYSSKEEHYNAVRSVSNWEICI